MKWSRRAQCVDETRLRPDDPVRSAGRQERRVARARQHNASGTRDSYTVHWYDGIGRPIAMGNYGTNSSAALPLHHFLAELFHPCDALVERILDDRLLIRRERRV